MEPISDRYGGARKMDEGESPPKADEEMVCTDENEGTKEVDEAMQEREDEGLNQDPKEEESPNEASDHGTPHANEQAAPKKLTPAAEV